MGDSSLSQVGICNSALLKVGADVISSLDDGSRAATICSTLYAVLRDEVLSQAPWRFALVQVQLTPLAQAPLFDYLYAMQLPSDCLRPLRVSSDPWTVQGGLLLCNDTSTNVLYIQKNIDESAWDPLFAEALAYRLAMDIALALVQSTPLKQEMEKSYTQKIALARSTNAVVGTPERLVADLWSGARKGRDPSSQIVAAGTPETYGAI